jgi:hypothetical protein
MDLPQVTPRTRHIPWRHAAAFSCRTPKLLELTAQPTRFPEGLAVWDVGKEKTLQTNSNS